MARNARNWRTYVNGLWGRIQGLAAPRSRASRFGPCTKKVDGRIGVVRGSRLGSDPALREIDQTSTCANALKSLAPDLRDGNCQAYRRNGAQLGTTAHGSLRDVELSVGRDFAVHPGERQRWWAVRLA